MVQFIPLVISGQFLTSLRFFSCLLNDFLDTGIFDHKPTDLTKRHWSLFAGFPCLYSGMKKFSK